MRYRYRQSSLNRFRVEDIKRIVNGGPAIIATTVSQFSASLITQALNALSPTDIRDLESTHRLEQPRLKQTTGGEDDD